MQKAIILFSRLRLVIDLPRLVEMLQSKNPSGVSLVRVHLIRCKAKALLRDLRGFLILPL